MKESFRFRIAGRAAMELEPGTYVNLGIGIPALVARHIPPTLQVTLMTESGLLGMTFPGRNHTPDPDLISATREPVKDVAGAAFFSSADSFAMIRGGHIDLSILGALEVDELGNLANWMVPGTMVLGMGGAMDLAVGAKRIVVAMLHTTREGKPKILRRCNLPLTALNVVNRIITEWAVFDLTARELVLREIAPDTSVEEMAKRTEAGFEVDKNLKVMPV
jgi:3-oxoacid CoA-transferase subunit B